MLIRFVVSNFKSFKNETEFNMLTGKGKGYQKHKSHIYHSPSGVDVLKTAAIYGANASGKSNLVEAINYLKNLVVSDDVEDTLMPLSKRFRLDNSYSEKPTTFRIEFVFKEIHFDYGLEISKGKITNEWLFLINDIRKNSDTLLFERTGLSVKFGEFFNSEDISYVTKFIEKEMLETQTTLNIVSDRVENNNVFEIIFNAFNNLAIVTPYSINTLYTASILGKTRSKKFAEEILVNSKTGIEELIIDEIDADSFFSYEDEDFKNRLIETLIEKAEIEGKDILDKHVVFQSEKDFHSLKKQGDKYIVSFLKTKHFSSSKLFELKEESDGTNRLFHLTPAFDDLINTENIVYIIDELERSMHPILAKQLMTLFSKANTSTSQLIFTTHETHLLDLELFRQDEIWFAEKKVDGSSEFYPLSKFKPREDKDIRKGYLQGRYGGIPYLGDFSKILSEN